MAGVLSYIFTFMYIVSVFRISAKVLVKVAVKRIFKTREVAAPTTVGVAHAVKEVLAKITEVVSGAFAFVILVIEVITELQEHRPEYRFTVGKLQVVA